MITTPANKTHPLVIIASVAVIIFAALGIGMMTGVIPVSKSETSEPAGQPAAAKETPKPAARTEAPKAVAAKPAPKPAPAKVCANCGTVESVRVIEQTGEGSGLGAVAGGVAGALLGSQVGQGRGNTAATIVGAAGGAYAGHQVEKQMKKQKSYELTVRMDDGTSRSFPFSAEPAYQVGDKVKVVDGALTRN